MSTTSKSPRRVLLVALEVGQEVLRDYSHRYSPKKFTQPQLFACLVLKEFYRLDYRKLTGLFRDAPELAQAIGLKSTPHFTTFQKAAERLLRSGGAGQLLTATLRLARQRGKLRGRIRLAALDGSGWESHHASHYYVRRRAQGGETRQKSWYRQFPKAGLACDTRTHLILGLTPGRGPKSDISHFRQLLSEALGRVRFDTVAADAGYDAEHAHHHARDELGVRTLIPATIGRPTHKRPRGRWRRWMQSHLHRTHYGQRWQIETVNSMLKRLQGSALRARSYWSQNRELHLRAITHNIMILRRN